MKFRKSVSIFLALVLVVCCGSVLSFAVEEKPFYVVLGDSIAYAYGVENAKEACYGKIVADTNGYDYVNHAVCGHTTVNLLDVLKNENVINDISRADIISISIGGNNFLLSDIVSLLFSAMVFENYEEIDNIVDEFYADFSEIIETIRAYNDDAVILIQTLYNPQSGYVREPYQQAVNRLNTAICRYVQENPGNIYVVDVEAVLGDDMDNYCNDSIHPSVKGNEKIAIAVLEKLYEIGLGENTEPVINVKGKDLHVSFVFDFYLKFIGTIFHSIAVVFSVFR